MGNKVLTQLLLFPKAEVWWHLRYPIHKFVRISYRLELQKYYVTRKFKKLIHTHSFCDRMCPPKCFYYLAINTRFILCYLSFCSFKSSSPPRRSMRALFSTDLQKTWRRLSEGEGQPNNEQADVLSFSFNQNIIMSFFFFYIILRLLAVCL